MTLSLIRRFQSSPIKLSKKTSPPSLPPLTGRCAGLRKALQATPSKAIPSAEESAASGESNSERSSHRLLSIKHVGRQHSNGGANGVPALHGLHHCFGALSGFYARAFYLRRPSEQRRQYYVNVCENTNALLRRYGQGQPGGVLLCDRSFHVLKHVLWVGNYRRVT